MSSSNDTAPDAYEKLVEKLLASPHYGERWARVWLDAARYADSDGYEKDKSRQVWAYRDWVIKAFNRRPALRPVRHRADRRRPAAERDAGPDRRDRLPPQLDAERGGRHRSRAVPHGRDVRPDGRGRQGVPRPDASRAPSATTTSSTRSRRKSITGSSRILNNDHEAERVVYTAAEQMKIGRIREQIREIEDELKMKNPDWRKQMAKWEAEAVEAAGVEDGRGRERQRQLTAIHSAEGRLDPGAGLRADQVQHADARAESGQDDHRVPARTAQRPEPAVQRAGPVVHGNVRAQRVRRRGRTGEGAGQAAEGEDRRRPSPTTATPSATWRRTSTTRARRSVSPARSPSPSTARTRPPGASTPGRAAATSPRVAVFVPEKPIELPDGGTLHFKLKQNHGGWNSDDHMNNNLGRFRLSVTDGEVARDADPLPPRVRDVLAVPAEKRSPAQVDAAFQLLADDGARVEGDERQDRGAVEAVAGRFDEPRRRRSATTPRDDVPPEARRLPQARARRWTPACPRSCIRCRPNADASRLTLAKWLVDKKSPTTARAFVEPRLAGVLRHRPRRHAGGVRHAGREAEPPGIARLARRGVHGATDWSHQEACTG